MTEGIPAKTIPLSLPTGLIEKLGAHRISFSQEILGDISAISFVNSASFDYFHYYPN